MGEDTSGRQYDSVEEMWNAEVGERGEFRDRWYSKAAEYWEKKESSVSGVLAGYESVSSVDVEDSLYFLNKISKKLKSSFTGDIEKGYALDCGAGIGRVTKNVLLHRFDYVDLVEPCEKYVETAKEYVESDRVKGFFCAALQNYNPTPAKYSCIWIQWCALYLTDEDLLDYFERCRKALRSGGVICVKENVVLECTRGFVVDKEDNSIMRTDAHYRMLFKKAKLRLLLDMKQRKFPKSLFPVYMYCLVPEEESASASESN